MKLIATGIISSFGWLYGRFDLSAVKCLQLMVMLYYFDDEFVSG